VCATQRATAVATAALALAAAAAAGAGCGGAGTSTTTGSGAFDAGSKAGEACSAPSEWNFFVMSKEAIVREAGSEEGLGGNLGGLSGADDMCQRAAQFAQGDCGKTWVAFLSVTDDGTGHPLNAIDRVGDGPWYDVNGLLLAQSKAGLVQARPDGDDQTVVYQSGYTNWVFTDCLTTEFGNCNHSYGDSHDTLTGSKADGTLYSTDATYTCNDWTSTTNNKSCDGTRGVCWPAIGHTWPAHSGTGSTGSDGTAR